MLLDQADVEQLCTARIDRYGPFIRLFRSRRGLQALLHRLDSWPPRMRVLDAGCGFGTASFALLDALREQGTAPASIDGFDLTPAMLSRFHAELAGRDTPPVSLQRADVLRLHTLPADWSGYDLVLSASMLEYLPRAELASALAGLRTRLAADGRIVVMITRRSLEAKLLVEWGWRALSYTRAQLRVAFLEAGYRDLRFIRFPWRYGWLNRANHVVVARA